MQCPACLLFEGGCFQLPPHGHEGASHPAAALATRLTIQLTASASSFHSAVAKEHNIQLLHLPPDLPSSWLLPRRWLGLTSAERLSLRSGLAPFSSLRWQPPLSAPVLLPTLPAGVRGFVQCIYFTQRLHLEVRSSYLEVWRSHLEV